MRRSIVIAALAGVLVVLVAACGGDDDGDEHGATPPVATETTAGDAANGEQVFTSAGCGGCPTFEAAGSTGSIGPSQTA